MIYVLDINGKIKATLSGGGGGDATAANQTSGAQKTQLVDAGGEVATITGGKLDVNASVDTTGLATSAIQTDGTQKSQIVDAGGEAVTVTGGKLDVNASVDTTGLATSAKQDTGNSSLASIDGKITAVNTGAVVVSSSALPSGAANQTKQDTGNTSLASIDGKITAVNTGAVVVSSSALPSGASTGAKQDTGNASVASIDTKTPALGQALAAASTPVVLTAAQITTLTPQTNSLTDTQLRATPVPVSGTVTATPTGTQNVDVTANTIGLALEATQLLIKAKTDNIDVALSTRNLEATQLLVKAKTDNLDVLLSTRTKPADQQHTIVDSGTLTAITNPLPAGTNLLGKVSIDQTTPGTTNAVQANAGTNLNTSLLALESGGNLAAIAASASVLDDWDEIDRAKVNLIVGQAGVSANDGNTDAGTQRVVIAANAISTNNSSTATLAANAIFTGISEDIISYSEARVTIYSDVASATDGLSIQQSTDNTNWIITDTYTVAAATGKTFAVPRQARYFRVVYTNGGAAQATFIIYVTYKRIGGSMSSQRASDNYTNETDLEQQQSFLMNYNRNTGTWYRTIGDSQNGLVVNPQGANIEYTRRLQEQQVLYAYSTLMEEMGATERYNSSRDFIEIR